MAVRPRPTGVRTLPPFRPGLTPLPTLSVNQGATAGPSPVTRHPQFHEADYKPHDAAGPSYNKHCPGHPRPPPLSPASPHPQPTARAEGRAMQLRARVPAAAVAASLGPSPRAPPRPLRAPAPSAEQRLCTRGCGRRGASPRRAAECPRPLRAGGGLSAQPAASRGRPRPAPPAPFRARHPRPPAPLAHARAAALRASSAGPPPRGSGPWLWRGPSSRAGRRGPGMRSGR